MTRIDYFVQIHDAGSATELHALRQQAETDGDLTAADQAQVNAGSHVVQGREFPADAGKQTQRWSGPAAPKHPVRIPTPTRAH